MSSTIINTLWQWVKPTLPILVTLALFSAGAWALFHLLDAVNFKDVIAQVKTTPWHIIGLSLVAMAIGYSALVGYDWSALRYINKSLPLPVIYMGGFLAYALGNTIGAGPVTGGAVRYRIYAALGLTGYDIAAIAVFGSVAFGVGSTMLGFGAMAINPTTLNSLTSIDPYYLRLFAIAAFVLSVSSLVWLATRQGEISIRGRRFTPPSLNLLLGQLAFTSIDILMAACVLYLLLPASDLAFIPFLALFAAAICAGVVSHVPGGVGVFETVILAALPASIPVEQAAAGLLLYRLIYYIVPFGLALIVLSLSEIHLAGRLLQKPQLRVLAPVFGAFGAIVPMAMSAMIFASGVYMLLASLIPATSEFAEEVELWLPVAIVESGVLLSSALGAALVIVAHGLLRRVEGAYWLAIAALMGGAVAAMLHSLDWERAIVLSLATLVMISVRREFYRSTRLTRDAFSLPWLLLMGSVVIACSAVYFFTHKATGYVDDSFWQLAVDRSAPRAIRASVVGSLVVALFALIYVLRPPNVITTLASAVDIERARAVIAKQDNPDANFALTGDKSLLFSDSGRAFLMYRVQGRSWLALGDPVGDPADAAQLGWKFFDAANAANARPVFYEVRAANLPLYIEMGLALHKMGEEAVINLASFSLDGPERKKLRTTYNRAGRDGYTFEVLPVGFDADLMAKFREISDHWLAAKNATEKQFSVGRFEPDYLSNFPMAVVRLNGEIVAFANILETDSRKRATIDLMRHITDTPSGLMEYLFIELALYLKAEGFADFTLGMAPLAGLETRRGSRWTARMGAAVYRHGGHFYNFDGLRNFKNKFDPDWRARFLVAPPRSNMVVIAADAAALIAGGMGRVFTPPLAKKQATDRKTPE